MKLVVILYLIRLKAGINIFKFRFIQMMLVIPTNPRRARIDFSPPLDIDFFVHRVDHKKF